MRSRVLGAFGIRGQGQRGSEGEVCRRQCCSENSGFKINCLGAGKLEPVVTHASAPSLTFCPGEGSNMLTFKLFQVVLNAAGACMALVTGELHFHFHRINI